MSEIRLSHRQTADFELLANGGFAPLEGFQGSEAWESVVERMRLPDGRPWPIPVTLASETGNEGETIDLIGHEGTLLGAIEVEEVRRHLSEGTGLERIVFAVRGSEAYGAFERALSER